MDHNYLGQYGPAIAKNLAKCTNLHTVYMGSNNLGQYGPETANNLNPSLHNVNMSGNNLGWYGIPIAKILAKYLKLEIVDMSANNLRKHGPETIENFALAPSLHTVYIHFNNLEGEPKTVEKLAMCLNLHRVSIEDVHRGPMLEITRNRNAQMHKSFKEAMDDTFKHTPPALLGLIEDYADCSIEFIAY